MRFHNTSIGFLLVSMVLLEVGAVGTKDSVREPQGTFYGHQPSVQQQLHPTNLRPQYVPVRRDHEKPQQDYPPIPQPHSNSNPYQVKYDNKGIPVETVRHNGLATEHGDRAALYGEFPYKVQVRKNGEFVAGGTLVKSPITGHHVIITATHVIDEQKQKFGLIPIQQFELKMGVVGKEAVGQVRKLKAMLPHPDFVKMNSESQRPVFNDIAILIPESDFVENDYVKPIDLPNTDNLVGPWVGHMVKVKGWGYGREAGHDGASSTLRVVEVPVWNHEKCRKVYWEESGKDIITDQHFCAGYENGGQDTCQGDSGGGATSIDRGKLYLAGVVSWGKGCGKPGYPGVYAKVTKYMDWLRQTLYNYEVRGILPPPLKDIRY